jgi:protease-4
VAPSQEIYEAVKKLKAHGKTVVVSMGSVAASGAYYLACPADRIFANPGTLTGSIGVYVEKASAGKLLDKVGLKFEVIKSGRFKDTGNFSRDYSPEEKAYLQAVIDDVFDQFVSAVSEERQSELAAAMKREGMATGAKGPALQAAVKRYARSLADGRIFTGRDAMDLGLVDELGDLEDAIDAAAKLAGIEGEPDVVAPRVRVTWTEYLTGLSQIDLKTFLKSWTPGAGLHVSYRAW